MAFDKLATAYTAVKKYLTSQQTLNFNLGEAAGKNDVEQVKKWLAAGAKSEPSSEWKSDSPLNKAIENGNVEIVKLLLAAGADVNAKPKYGKGSPFVTAAAKGNVEICAAMLAAKADVNVTSEGGHTPYSYAVAANNKTLMEILEAAGAKPDTANNRGWSPLFYAVRNNDVATTERLLKHGVRTDRTDDEGRNVLDIAKAYDRPAAYNAVQVFLDAKVPEWQVTGAQEVTHVLMRRPQGYRLTDIFNFETKERTVITHNYETGRDSTARSTFDKAEATAQQAEKYLPAAKPVAQPV